MALWTTSADWWPLAGTTLLGFATTADFVVTRLDECWFDSTDLRRVDPIWSLCSELSPASAICSS